MSAWSPLRSKVFRTLWVANVVSNIGSTMNDTAAVWTMTAMAQSPTLISLMQTMSSLPLFLLALPAGALADLVDRRRLILLAQVGALLTAAGMAALAYLGQLSSPLLLLATFQLGIASAFTTPAWQALIPEIVGKSQLPSALALGGIGFNVARSLGPVAGGLLVASLGPAPVFALNAVSFGAVIFAMVVTAVDAKPRSAEQEQMIGAMVAAIRYARHAQPMRRVLFRSGMHVFAASAAVALLPILIRSRHWSASDYGVLMGSYGLGAITLAVLILPNLRARYTFDGITLWAALGSAVAMLAMAFASGRIMLGAALFLAGGCWMTAMNTFSLAAQSAFPNWVRARSSAIYLVVVQGAFGVGALIWGRLTDHWHAQAALTAAAIWLGLSAVIGRWFTISHLEGLDLSPSNHWTGHTLAQEPAADDGPVLITIEYHIDPSRAAEFREAMKPLRSTRLRDGAFRCTLFVDLDDPTLFRETFLVGSWAEHLRQHQRATMEDRRIEEAVLAFHQGSTPPKVHHYLMVNLRGSRP